MTTTATPVPVLMAAFRDASFWRRPDTRFAKMAHVLCADGKLACGIAAISGRAFGLRYAQRGID
ncbi:hypothetical protein H8F21_14100 [Pseudomonas sp. P66]|uniref:Uncharacterized protein n=1 Tax=Pseudomonas arcuscaelestis TaxID=2710591 RepID=A0ABS2BYK0_9PSED|nr:hypothetical protein [Pseudomonas arcuscaelestis]MBM5458697.1 hypothetical protein [Pseudomonas arcuscaelestis]